MPVHPVQAVCHLGGLHGARGPRAAAVAAPPGNGQPADVPLRAATEPAGRLADGRLQGPDRQA